MTNQKKQSFLYGATILMASMIIVKIIGAVFKIPLVNILDTVGMGYFSQAYSLFTTIYALTVTGLSAAVARMVSENATRGRFRDVRKILKLSTIIFFLLGILGFIIVFFSAKGISNIIKMPNAYWSFIMISPAIFFCCIMASYRGYYEGLSNMFPTAITQVVEVIVKLITGLSFAGIVMSVANKQYLDTGVVFGMLVNSKEAAQSAAIPFAAAAATLGVSVSTLIGLIYIYIRFKIRGDGITKQQMREAPKSIRTKVLLFHLIKISIPITLGAVVIQLSVLIDNFTIPNLLQRAVELKPQDFSNTYDYLLKPGQKINELLFGTFVTVVTVFNLVPAFTNIFGKSALPNVTEAWILQDKRKIKTNIESVLRMTMLIAAPASLGIVFLAKPIVALLFKTESAVVIGPSLLSVLGIASLFVALVTPMNAIMQGIGRMDLPVKFIAVGAFVKIILNITLVGIPSINIMGASISTVVCYSIISFLSLSKLRKVAGVRLDYIGVLLKPFICGIICAITAFLSYKVLEILSYKVLEILSDKALTFLNDNSIIAVITFVLSVGIGVVFYVFALGIFKVISKDDIKMLPKSNKIQKVLEKFKIIR